MRRSLRIFITFAIMAIFATGAYAFTAAISVPESEAGYGIEGVTGFAVTNVQYNVEDSSTTTTPLVTGVQFDMSPTSTDVVRARVNGSGYGICGESTTTAGHYSCAFPTSVPVANVVTLEVLAGDLVILS